MLFLNLENQLFFILMLVFSSYLLINALVLRPQSIRLRVFGLAFALPFLLTIAAFLTAPYHKSGAMALLFLGQILLILLCTIILLIKQESDILKLFYLLPFILAAAALIFAASPLFTIWFVGFYFIELGLILVILVLLVYSFLQKAKNRLLAYSGLFVMTMSSGLWLILKVLTLESLLLMGLGYGACTVYIYQNTSGIFFKEYQKNSDSLRRMNASMQMEVIRRVEEIERSNRKLLELSKTDRMTGLYVKSVVVKNLETFLERSPHTTLTLLMIDIDKFKEINDTLGHQIGDHCIKTLSTLAQASFRKDDIIGRYGGDEFLILLPETPTVKAYLIADRFRQQIQSKLNPQITISVGIANYPEDGKTSSSLIEAADKALYVSKENGKNSVTLYSTINKVGKV